MRLVDTDKLPVKRINIGGPIIGGPMSPRWINVVYADDIAAAPTITPESLVRHGRWIDVYYYGAEQSKAIGTCSYCKKRGELRTRRNDYCIWYIDMPFCPDCGAKMDLEG